MKKVSVLGASLVASVLASSAANINLTVTGVESLTDGSNPLANGDAVWVGMFDSGFDVSSNITSFSTLEANFGFFDSAGAFQGGAPMLSTSVTDFGGGLPGSFNASGSVEDANGSTPPVIVWAFDDPTPSAATSYGIFQLTNLENGVAPLGTSQSLDFAVDFQSVIFGAYDSGAELASLQVVPEVSHYGFLAALVALSVASSRRRRN